MGDSNALYGRKPVIEPVQDFAINDLVANNAVVGTLQATNADSNTTLHDWQIVGGTGAGRFAIGPSSGQLSVASRASIDFYNAGSYLLMVKVERTFSSATQTVTITLVRPLPFAGK